MDNYNTVVQIDTGADVTAVPDTLYNQGQFGRPVKVTKVLLGSEGKPLKFTATLSKNNTCTKEEVYVVKELCTEVDCHQSLSKAL